MWKLSDRPKTVKVTKTLAKEFAEMDKVDHERPLSERRLQVYGRLLKEGLFRPVTWARAICGETNCIYRVNGQHTSILLSGLDELPEFFVTVEDYICDTLEDVARLYSTFDSRMASRNTNDINQSFASVVPELKEMSSKIINVCVTGLGFHVWKMDAYNHPPAERAELLLEHSEFVVWVNEMLRGGIKQTQHLRRQPVIAAMKGSWDKSRKAATEFWTMVRDETGATPHVPDRKLAKWLLMTDSECSRISIKTRKAQPKEFYVRCIHAWNAWRKSESTNLNYRPDAKIPSMV